MNEQDNKKDIAYDDIDADEIIGKKLGKKRLPKTDIDKDELLDLTPEEKKYDDIEDDDEIRPDEINNERKANTRKVKKTIKSEIMEWVLCFVIAYGAYLVINFFFGTISGVKQSSMFPTAIEGEKVLIQRTVLFKKDLEYGQIITFKAPNEAMIKTDNNIAVYDEKNLIESFLYNFIGIGKSEYIKRVIGLPGDHIVINDDGTVYRNDEKLDEPYLKDGITNKEIYNDIIVPEGTVFVMGDNRLVSKVSRYFGCVPISKVDGYVIIRVWPFTRFGEI